MWEECVAAPHGICPNPKPNPNATYPTNSTTTTGSILYTSRAQGPKCPEPK